MREKLRKLGKKILHEFAALSIITVYFAVGFALILLLQNLILSEKGVEPLGYFGAIFLALLIGKVVLVLNKLPIVNLFRRQPRIVHVIYITVLFTVVALLVGAVERVVKKLVHGETAASAFAEASLSTFLAITIALSILFGLLFLLREMNNLLGPGVFWRALFRPPERD